MLASSFDEVTFLSENPNDLCDRLRLLFQKEQAAIDTNKLDNEIFVIVGKFLEYKSITPKQHQHFLIKYNPLHTRKNSKTIYYLCLSINTQI